MKRCIIIFMVSVIPSMSSAAEEINNPDIVSALSAGPVNISSIFQVIAALLAILVLIVALSWVFRKYGQSYAGANSNMRVISALSLGGKEKAVLMQIGDEQILIGVSPGNIRKIHLLAQPVIEKESEPDNFISKLNNEIKKVISK